MRPTVHMFSCFLCIVLAIAMAACSHVDDEECYRQLASVRAADMAQERNTSDSLIVSVVKCMEQSGDHRRLAEAYYYAGRCNADMMNGDKAVFYFQLALMEDSVHVTDSLHGCIASQMGHVYLRNGLADEAADMYRTASFYCEKVGDTAGVRRCDVDLRRAAEQARNNGQDKDRLEGIRSHVQSVAARAAGYKLQLQNRELQAKGDGLPWWPFTLLMVGGGVLAAWGWRRRRREEPQPRLRKLYIREVDDLVAQRLADGKALQSADWQMIEQRLHEAVPQFKDRLYRYYNFSETEYRICLLIRFGIAPSCIAKLMALGTSSVSQSRLRMQQKVFGGQGTAKDWDGFIVSL